MSTILEAQGVEGPWVSIQIAAKCCGMSVDAVRKELDRAEDRRITKQKCDLRYGVHYKLDNDPHGTEVVKRRAFRVHIKNFQAVVLLPADKRVK